MVLALGSSEAASETKAQAGFSLDCLCSQRQRDTGRRILAATITIFFYSCHFVFLRDQKGSWGL